MTFVIGGMLGAGLVLMISPRLWPRGTAHSSNALADRIRAALALAGFGRVPVAAFIVVSALVGLAAGAASFIFIPVPFASVLAGALGAILPTFIVRQRAAARLRLNRSVWPDVVDHLVASVRSGLSLPDSVASLGEKGPDAVRPAFLAFAREYRASGRMSAALDALKERLADPVADRIIESLRMAREVGGSDLTTVLRSLAIYLREAASVRAEVEARQSWIRNAARLGVAAPWVVLAILSSRPEAAAAYNTPTGFVVILAGLALTVFAYRAMMMLGKLPVERRWFG